MSDTKTNVTMCVDPSTGSDSCTVEVYTIKCDGERYVWVPTHLWSGQVADMPDGLRALFAPAPKEQ